MTKLINQNVCRIIKKACFGANSILPHSKIRLEKITLFQKIDRTAKIVKLSDSLHRSSLTLTILRKYYLLIALFLTINLMLFLIIILKCISQKSP